MAHRKGTRERPFPLPNLFLRKEIEFVKDRSALDPSAVLWGRKLYLRPPKRSELEYIRRLWSDPDTMKEVGGPVTDFSNEKAEKWFARMVQPGRRTDCYCLIFDPDDQAVGEVSFHNLDWGAMTAEFNIKIDARYRGKGYAHEAMRVFFRFFFSDLGGEVMVDDIALENRTGQRALLAFGFAHDPAVSDAFRVRLTRERFLALHGLESSAS